MPRTHIHSPLLGDAGLRACLGLSATEVLKTLRTLVAAAEEVVVQVAAARTPCTWDGLVAPFDEVHDHLAQAWGRVEHLHNTMDAPKWRQVVAAGNDLIVGYWTRFDQHATLYKKYQTLRGSSEYRRLSPARRRVIDLQLRDFRLAGADVSGGKKRELARLTRTLAHLSKTFSNRVLDATNAVTIATHDPQDIAGIPDSLVAAARARARSARQVGWHFSLQGSEPSTLLRTAARQSFRARVYHALNRNGSELGPKMYDTTPVMMKILVKRQALARLLGFATFADYSLSRKMAARPERASRFIRGLALVAKRQAKKEFHTLEKYARRHFGLVRLQAWDMAYVVDQLRAKKFGSTQDQLRQYFPHPAVLKTLEDTVARVFGVRLKRAKNFTPYHPDVFRYDAIDGHGVRRGSIVVDLFNRPTKRAGAWAGEDTSRRLIGKRVRPPVANCTCNFVPPDAAGTAWLTHDDVHTLFHEFGHVLNHVLSDVLEPRVGGTAGVEWDAVELPSQWMERFTWEPAVLHRIHTFGAPRLPAAALKQITQANAFMSGLYVLRQARFGLFDLSVHQVRRPTTQTALKLWRQACRDYDVMPLPADNRFPNFFHHIFDGGYAAGYYSYLWAEIMAADAFAPLKKRPTAWRALGERFRVDILAVGGSRPAARSFQAFRGRLPRPQALMADYGLRRA